MLCQYVEVWCHREVSRCVQVHKDCLQLPKSLPPRRVYLHPKDALVDLLHLAEGLEEQLEEQLEEPRIRTP